MSAIGYLQVNAFASQARLPLPDTAIVVTSSSGQAIAMALTDRSGQILPLELQVPDKAESQAPNPKEVPFAMVNIHAHQFGYETVIAQDVQIFAETTTVWNLEMIPLPEYPDQENPILIFPTPPQNL